MQKNYGLWLCVILIGYMVHNAAASNPLSPTTPVVIINNGSAFMPVMAANNSDGFITTTIVNSNAFQSSFSTDNGAIWANATPVLNDTYLPVWVGSNSAGFMATWIGPDIGFNTFNPEWSFSSDDGTDWSSPASIIASPSTTIYSPVVVWGTSTGFMASWADSNDGNAYAAFTSNNGGTWSTPTQLTPSHDVNTAVMVTGTGSTFMIAWANDTDTIYTRITNNNGATWNIQVSIAHPAPVASDVWVAYNSTGFLTTWADTNGNGWSSLSTDNGATWSTAIQITSGVNQGGNTNCDVSVAAVDSGFVAAWIDTSNNVFASFLANETNTWSTPVAITNTGTAWLGQYLFAHETGYSFVGITGTGNSCLFAWLDTNGNTYSSFARLGLEVAITTQTHVIRAGVPTVINATVSGGVPPYTVVWSDGFTQVTSNSNFSRTVTIYNTMTYQITQVTDALTNSGGPSNTITLTVLPCPRICSR